VHGYWCSSCKKIVSPCVTEALSGSMIGIRTIVYAAWLHYFVGVSVRNIVKILSTSAQFKATPGGLTLAWKKLADLLTPQYETIRQNIKNSAALHADETSWRISGKSHWLWCFATKAWCYYEITKSRGS
jgi:transposase